jgi:hypothetical protein
MWESIVKSFERILEKPAILVLVLGFVLAVLGAANGIHYKDILPLSDTKAWILLGVGLVLLLGGAALSVEDISNKINAKSYNIKVTSPLPNETVGIVDIRGTAKRRPPAGYKLMVFRMHQNRSFVPMHEVHFDTDQSWSLIGCNLGGKPGDNRTIGVYLVGKSGQALIRYYKEADEFHRNVKTKADEYLPRITEMTEDMVCCVEVTVKKG